jgi:hypothetical protein
MSRLLPFQGPAHGRLAEGFDASVHAVLVRTNRIRTAAWTALALLDTWMLYVLFEAGGGPVTGRHVEIVPFLADVKVRLNCCVA